MPAPGALVLLRHGQSVLNAQDRFTGLLDPSLTSAGGDEAARAGALLASSSFSPDMVYTSTLTRTRDTARIVLEVLGGADVPVHAVWQLNERSYGSLTGRSRSELLSELGPEVFHFWRRSYYGAPPPMPGAELGAIRRSRAFAGLPHEALQPTESLCGVVKRVRTFWYQHLRPRLIAGEDFLVIGHGNSLRALCLVLDRLTHAEVEALNIPTGHPLVYRFAPGLVPVVRGRGIFESAGSADRRRPGRRSRRDLRQGTESIMYELQISGVRALQILDSRGYPTVKVWLTATDGTVSVASAPSGASTGAHEAVELRDGGQEYSGRGVQKAVANVEGEISGLLTSRGWQTLADLDQALIGLDGTPGKSRLGANAIVAVSMAAARAFATTAGLPLHVWIGQTLGRAGRLPVPHLNVLNGGQHAANPLEFQEFMIAPAGAPSFADGLRWGSDVYHALARRLRQQGLATGLGDEGGYAPDIARPEEALDLIVAAIEDAGYTPGRDGIAIALDPAANSFYTDGTYTVAGKAHTPEQMVSYYEKLITDYPIWSLEDPLAEEDTGGWPALTAALGDRVQVVGDDLFVTSADRVREGIRDRSATAVLIKPNQAGTVSETFDTLTAASEGGFGAMVSHRSGETDDTFVADLVVGSGCGQLKSGAPARGERVAKYNRLLEITDEDPSLPYGPEGTYLNDADPKQERP